MNKIKKTAERKFQMAETERKKRSIREYGRIFLSGFIMGSADVVPGVSGGTMAFILGIYQELIDSIRAFLSPEAFKMAFRFQVKKAYRTLPWPFLLSLGLGILTAIVLLSSKIKWMLENRPALIWSFFFGLVLASIFAVFHRVSKWSFDRIIGALAGAAAAWIIVGLPLTQHPPEGLWYIAVCGAIAICAMILPGISGSFILVLMGKYETVLGAVHSLKSGADIGRNLLILTVFMVGIVIGIGSFVRLLGWLFRKYHDVTVAVLIGFMAGSLRKVWPWKGPDGLENVLPAQFSADVAGAAVLGLLGFVLVLAIEFIAKRLEAREQVLSRRAGEES